jgi:GTPase SAR1 family protein
MVDTSGLHFIQECRKETLMSMNGLILMYSVTSRPSFYEVEKLRKTILTQKPEASKLPMLIIATNSDSLFGRQVSTKEGETLAKRLGCLFVEISNQTSNVEEALFPLLNAISDQHKATPKECN